jgi:hypothetical protein
MSTDGGLTWAIGWDSIGMDVTYYYPTYYITEYSHLDIYHFETNSSGMLIATGERRGASAYHQGRYTSYNPWGVVQKDLFGKKWTLLANAGDPYNEGHYVEDVLYLDEYGKGYVIRGDKSPNSTSIYNDSHITTPDITTHYAITHNGLHYCSTLNDGIYMSRDFGKTWQKTGLSIQHVTSLVAKGTDIFASTSEAGIFKSSDDGANWYGYNGGLSTLHINDLKSDAGEPYYIASDSGVYISSKENTKGITSDESIESFDPIRLYPNPTDSKILIGLSNKKEKIIAVTIYDMLGRVIYSLEKPSAAPISFLLGKTIEGAYLVHIVTDISTYNRKLQIVH